MHDKLEGIYQEEIKAPLKSFILLCSSSSHPPEGTSSLPPSLCRNCSTLDFRSICGSRIPNESLEARSSTRTIGQEVRRSASVFREEKRGRLDTRGERGSARGGWRREQQWDGSRDFSLIFRPPFMTRRFSDFCIVGVKGGRVSVSDTLGDGAESCALKPWSGDQTEPELSFQLPA